MEAYIVDRSRNNRTPVEAARLTRRLGLVACAAIALTLALGSCGGSGGSSSSDAGGDLAIAGSWHMQSRNQDITFTNATIVFGAGANSGLTGTILSYDNDERYLVMRWTNHPAYTGKYQRWNWSGSPVSALNIGAEQDSASAAEADASTKYTDTVARI